MEVRIKYNSYTHDYQLEAFSLVDRWYVPTYSSVANCSK